MTTNPMENISVGIDLSNHELWYILSFFPSKAIPSAQIPQEMDERTLNTLLRAAEDSLQARGLLSIDTDPETGVPTKRTLDQQAAVLVGIGLIAQQSLFMTYETSKLGLDITWLYFTPDLTIAHTRTGPSLHRFFTVNSGDLFITTLVGALHLDTRQSAAPPYSSLTLPAGLLAEMRANPTDAYELLKDNTKADEESLFAFAKSAVGAEGFNQVIWVQSEETHSFRVLYTAEGGYWLLEGAPDDAVIEAVPVSPTDITGRITGWVQAR